jgi:hypothetical protein
MEPILPSIEKLALHLEQYQAVPDGTEVEVEVRFQEITLATFNRVRERLNLEFDNEREVTHISDHFVDGKRRSVYSKVMGHDEFGAVKAEVTTLEIEKDQKFNELLKDWNLRIAVSLEKAVKVDEKVRGPASPRNTFRRQKTRYSYVSVKQIRFDLTHVIESSPGKDDVTRYEIEIEVIEPLIKTKEKMKTLTQEIEKLLLLILDSDRLYSQATLQKLKTDLKSIFNLPMDVDAKRTLVQARNLKIRDLIWGGIVEGADRGKPAHVKYTVTHKAEGVRKMLIFHETGIWLAFPPMEFCLLTNEAPPKALWGLIVDGEDVQNDKTEHLFLPFDTVCAGMHNGLDIQKKPHMERRKMVEGLYQHPMVKGLKNLKIVKKEYIAIPATPNGLFEAVQKILKKPTEYQTDGLIFTPDNVSYLPQTEKGEVVSKKPIWQRKLSTYADVCKWKPATELTIDLELQFTVHGGDSGVVLLAYGKDQKRVPFVGTENFPFNIESQLDLTEIRKVTPKTIVQVGPRFEKDRIVLELRMLRNDKTYPNYIDVANDVWEDINTPLDLETLKGEDSKLTLMRKYHNRIKRDLLSSFSQSYPLPNRCFLVDIGSGNGGDLGKWPEQAQVLAIEPREKHVKEFERRLEMMKTKPNVHLLKAAGQETDLILTTAKKFFQWERASVAELPPLVITMMLSMSFFWKDEKTLQQLTATIRELTTAYHAAGGTKPVELRYLTIEGTKTAALFKQKGKSVQLGPVKMKMEEQTVRIQIEGSSTVVDEQEEYLVHPKQLLELLGFQSVFEKEATEERLLSEHERIFSSLYNYGLMKETIEEISLRNTPKLCLRVDSELEDFSTQLYRVPHLQVENTLLHCVVQATNSKYATASVKEKLALVAAFEEQLLEDLQKSNPEYETLEAMKKWQKKMGLTDEMLKKSKLSLNSYYNTLIDGQLPQRFTNFEEFKQWITAADYGTELNSTIFLAELLIQLYNLSFLIFDATNMQNRVWLSNSNSEALLLLLFVTPSCKCESVGILKSNSLELAFSQKEKRLTALFE